MESFLIRSGGAAIVLVVGVDVVAVVVVVVFWGSVYFTRLAGGEVDVWVVLSVVMIGTSGWKNL